MMELKGVKFAVSSQSPRQSGGPLLNSHLSVERWCLLLYVSRSTSHKIERSPCSATNWALKRGQLPPFSGEEDLESFIMLNEIQKQVIETWFSFCTDDIKGASPALALEALRAVNDDELFYELRSELEENDILYSVEVIRRVLNHPCPQNRVSKSCDSSGRVVWVDDKGNEHSEEEGMLGLTARQDPGQPGITKEDVYRAVNMLLQREKQRLQRQVEEWMSNKKRVEDNIEKDLKDALQLSFDDLFILYSQARKNLEQEREEHAAAKHANIQLQRQLHHMREVLEQWEASRGVQRYPDGSTYEGDSRDGQKWGRGTCLYQDGSKYEGEWVRDLRHGHGKFTDTDGSYYEGTWAIDKRHGHGTFLYPGGRGKYVGQWKDDMRHGQGTRTWPDGSIYCGQYEQDKAHGEGKLTWPDDTVYTGTWRGNKRHGKGVEKDPYGISQAHVYVNGIRSDGVHTL